MTPRPALSTPRPLPRKREHRKQRTAIALASVEGKAIATEQRGRAPAKAIQKDEATLARRTIQVNDASAVARRGRAERIEALRATIRDLVVEISHAADVELLDLMADEVGSFARHKAAQEARTWAATAGVTLETGLMQLDRAIPFNLK
ncbi:hypothetical protein [Burkholderia pseudomallei]|nr:hypothetical protein [Burkholderia pseudomallei]AGR71458.1 hypothetical protein BDL_3031 [Burkholderia pseudomallei MSHR305]AHK64046.1 hypothetical protein BBX_1432 [Burkholderia pseudomallei MSHR520]AIP79014.1 hypothetical protein JE55_592 [Burkholderia pseudomallei]KGW53880.1 hypothetical protein Y029_3061 [Burkholderia pseudomallei MSHR303]